MGDEVAKKPRTGLSQLERLSLYTTVVADTGEVNAIRALQPTDATTNPSLILKASSLPEYAYLVKLACAYANSSDVSSSEKLDLAMDKLAVSFGCEIAGLVPGLVSTEVDARLSFDTARTVARGRQIIRLYEESGVGRERVLIKIAATYEGVEAAKVLEREGIRCNVTLVFSLVQAVACARGGVTLISPFVGRILDWHKAKSGCAFSPEDDPGVLSVKSIYAYFKRYRHSTVVMGASFRNRLQVLALAGCDKLTIAPALLEELRQSTEEFDRALDPFDLSYQGEELEVSEVSFRFALNEDAMATEKLAEGVRLFSADILKLESIVKSALLSVE